jgi:DNA-binding transcriptional LysR family regulator
MEITTLHEFVVFARYLNIAKAAKELHMASSSLSRHIAALEKEVGVALLHRDRSGRSHLTAMGSFMLKEANELIAAHHGVLKRIEQMKQSLFEDIRIAYALDDRQVIDCISLVRNKYQSLFSSITVRPYSKRGASYLSALENNEADIIVEYFLNQMDDSRYTMIPLASDSVVVAVSKGGGGGVFSHRTSVNIEELSRLSFYWPSASGDSYLNYVMGLFAGCQAKPHVIYVDADNMDEFYMYDLGEKFWIFASSYILDHACCIPQSYRENIQLLDITGVETTLQRYAVYRKDNPNRAVSLFAEHMGDVSRPTNG